MCVLLCQDYKELKVPLSDIPVTLYTVAELMRLCLRKHDAETDGASKADSEDAETVEDEVVGVAKTGSFIRVLPLGF